MKRSTQLSLLALILVSLLLPGCWGQSANKIRVATDATWPPFEYVNEKTKQLEGFDIDLMNEVARKAGLQVDYVNVGFESLLEGLATCKYDAAISSITITAERKKSMAFSGPYVIAGQVVVVRKDNTDVVSKDNLGGKQVGAEVATTGAMEVDKIKGAVLKPYDKIDVAYQDLMNRRIDAVVSDYPLALAYVGKNPDKLKTVGSMFTSEFYGIAVCTNKAELLAKINTALKSCLDEGLVDKLFDKWISSQR